MGRKIIVLSDGTGNAAGKLFRTNVWRIYQALDLSDDEQIAFYDDGVGTSSFKPLAILGGVFGWGLKRNILDLYTFLCLNYRPGDEIYGFGFSRGAFTIRVLAKFVLSQGLVADYSSEEDLWRKARSLYRRFRSTRRTPLIAKFGRALRFVPAFIWDAFTGTVSYKTQPVEKIRFLGLWDTVDAYGLPVYELKVGIDRYIWPLALEDRKLDKGVGKACHALSIDDRRTTFHPLLWDETEKEFATPKASTDSERLTQVWFAGVHSNLGGGYPDDALSFVSLRWMAKEAIKQQLKFNQSALDLIEAGVTPYGRVYNSRAGLGSYYRYDPRRLDPPTDNQGAVIPYPKVHESVLLRMASGTDAYAPLSLPDRFGVVAEDPTPPQAKLAARKSVARIPNTRDFSTYLKKIAPAARAAMQKSARAKASTTSMRTVADLRQAPQAIVDLIWDTVWWRRLVYFLSMVATIVLLLFPLVPGWITAFGIRSLDSAAEGAAEFVRIAANLMSGILPAFAKPWIDSFRENPTTFGTVVAAIIALIWWGGVLEKRIHDRALSAWNRDWNERRFKWFFGSLTARLLALVALVIGLAIFAYFSYQRILHPDLSQCQQFKDDLTALAECKETYQWLTKVICWPLIALCGIVAFAVPFYLYFLRKTLEQQRNVVHGENPGFFLWLANGIRRSPPFEWVHWAGSTYVIPFAFAVIVIFLSVVLTSRLTFTFMSAGGNICAESSGQKLDKMKEEAERNIKAMAEKTVDVELNLGCLATGVWLSANNRYRIEVTDANNWKKMSIWDPNSVVSPNVAIGTAGFPTPWLQSWRSWALLIKVPFRRYLWQNWFVPVIRIGAGGADEHVVDSKIIIVQPRRDGELYFFVNDAVYGIPELFFSDWWDSRWQQSYKTNKGTAKLKIKPADPAVAVGQAASARP